MSVLHTTDLPHPVYLTCKDERNKIFFGSSKVQKFFQTDTFTDFTSAIKYTKSSQMIMHNCTSEDENVG